MSSIDEILKNPEIIPGRFIVNGNWIYYIKLLDAESGKTAIYKMDIATSKSIEVCKDSPYNIYTDGEWIYYDKLADGESESDEVYTEQIGVYKIKPDGTSRTQIIKGVRLEDVRNGWIYYSKVEMTNGEEGDNCLFRMKIYSSNSKLVLKDFQVIQLVDKYIYYLNNYAIGRINLDGSNPKIICNEDQLFKDTYFQRFLVKDNVMYFSTTDSSESINKSEGLFRVNLDGTGMKNILYANIHDSDFVVYKDRIFYVSVEPPKENSDKISNLFTYSLNEFDTKNNKSKPLFQVYDSSLNLVGDWLYYSKTYQKFGKLNLNEKV